MSAPFRYERIHMLPRLGDPSQDFATTHYVSWKKLPGFVSLSSLGRELYVCPRNPLDPADPVEVDIGHGERLIFGLGVGGTLMQYITASGKRLMNYADLAGRGFQGVEFWTAKAKPDEPEREGQNPTWAGSWYSDYPGDIYKVRSAVPPGYRSIDFVQGGINTRFEVEGDPATDILTEGHALDFDPDGTHSDPLAGSGHALGGSVLSPLLDSRGLFRMRVQPHHVRKGLHKIRMEVIPEEGLTIAAGDTYSMVPLTMHPTFGFDEAWAFRADTGTWTALHEPVLPGITTDVLEWRRLSHENLRARLAAPHTRRGSAMGRVMGATGLSGGHRKIIFDQGPDYFRVDPADIPETVLPGGGILSVVPFRIFDTGSNQARIMSSDYVCVNDRPAGGMTENADVRGGYWDVSPLGEGAHAVIFRALPGSSAPWSFQEDICVGIYFLNIDPRLPKKPARRRTMVRCVRGPQEPKNGEREPNTLVMHHALGWPPGVEHHIGPHVEDCYLLVGTFEECQASVEWLRGQP